MESAGECTRSQLVLDLPGPRSRTNDPKRRSVPAGFAAARPSASSAPRRRADLVTASSHQTFGLRHSFWHVTALGRLSVRALREQSPAGELSTSITNTSPHIDVGVVCLRPLAVTIAVLLPLGRHGPSLRWTLLLPAVSRSARTACPQLPVRHMGVKSVASWNHGGLTPSPQSRVGSSARSTSS